MNTIYLDYERVSNIMMDNDFVDDEIKFEQIEKPIWKDTNRTGYQVAELLFQDMETEKYYKGKVERKIAEDYEFDTVNKTYKFVEVKQVEKIVKVWEIVK